MPTMLQIPTTRSHMTRSPASHHHPTSERSPAFIYPRVASHVDCGHTDVSTPRGCSGVESHYSLPLQREARQKLVASDFRDKPHPPANRKPLQVNECSSDSIQENLGNLPVQNSSYLHFRTTQFCSHSQNPHLMVLRVGFVEPLLVISL